MAANRIKGITIELNGDTTGLDKALKGVNKEIKDTQSALRDVNKLLKLDPTNTNLLKQKQDLLKKAVDDTAKKLETEKTALEQLKAKSTTGEVTKEQQALEREITDTEQSLKNLTRELDSFGSVGSQKMQILGQKVSEVGGKISSVGSSLTKNVTVPITAAAGASVLAWKEVDAALDIVAVKTGKTGKELEDLQKIVEDIATNIPTDFATAAEAVGEVNTRFGLTGKALEDLSTKYVEFAELNSVDVTTAIDSSQKAMEAWGVKAEDAGKYLDVLNATAQNSGIDIGTLTSSLVTNAPALQELGFSASDAAKFLGDMEKSGLDSSTVMTGLKRAMVKATKEGKPLSQALKETEKAIKGAGSETDATRIAMDFFGTKAGASIGKAVRESKLSFDDMGTSLETYAGNIETTFGETVDPLDDVKMAMNDLKLIGTDIIETSAPMITKALEILRDILKDVSEKWNGMNDGQKESIIKFALFAAAAGPVLSVLGGIVSGAGNTLIAFGKLPAAMTAAKTAFGTISTAVTSAGGIIPALGGIATAAAPILIGGAVVVGIVAATVLIVKNWDKIKAAAKKLGETIKTKWNDIKTKTKETWNNVKKTVSEKFNSAKTAAVTAATNLKTSVTEKFNSAKSSIKTTAENIASTVKEKFNTAKTNAASALETLKSDVSSKLSSAKETAVEKAKEIAKTLKDKFNDGKDNVKKALEKIDSLTGTHLGDAFKTAEKKAGDIASALKNNIGDALEKVTGKLSGLKSSLSNFKWTFPKPKLPHFSIETGSKTIAGHTFSYPKGIKVDWYKKAYENALMFTSPTVLQTPSGYKGFGDGNGGEIVLSDKKLREIAGGGTTINVYGAQGQSVDALADAIQQRLIRLQRQRGAAGLA